MKYISYAQNLNDLSILYDAGIEEVIISCRELSRLQTTSFKEMLELFKRARELDFKIVLEWDILLCEVDFSNIVETFNQIDESFYDIIRVQDAGVLEFVIVNTNKKIQFILETGNHNLTAIKTWEEYIGNRLERLVLSVELNKDKISEYSKALSCEVEMLGLGRILIFYSPRKLLTPLASKKDIMNDYLEASGESEESPHKGFPIIENRHGTFMFHIKDLCLIDKFEELVSIGLNNLRIDLRFDDLKLIKQISKVTKNEDAMAIKEKYKSEVIRGYFQTNKSDVLFKKLKNYRIQRKDESYIGEVLEAQKSEFMAILIKSERQLKLNDELRFITPEGKEHTCKVHQLKDSNLDDIDESKKNQLALINYMSGVWTKSQVYFA